MMPYPSPTPAAREDAMTEIKTRDISTESTNVFLLFLSVACLRTADTSIINAPGIVRKPWQPPHRAAARTKVSSTKRGFDPKRYWQIRYLRKTSSHSFYPQCGSAANYEGSCPWSEARIPEGRSRGPHRHSPAFGSRHFT